MSERDQLRDDARQAFYEHFGSRMEERFGSTSAARAAYQQDPRVVAMKEYVAEHRPDPVGMAAVRAALDDEIAREEIG